MIPAAYRAAAANSFVRRLSASAAVAELPLAVVMNEEKLNYDGSLDWSGLHSVAHVRTFGDTTPHQLPERAQGAKILITKACSPADLSPPMDTLGTDQQSLIHQA